MPFKIAYITFPDRETAEELTGKLIEEKLAACANIFPIRSCYWWEGNIQNEKEWVGIVKTTAARMGALIDRMEEIHPYDVPCVMQIDVRANAAYEEWIRECVASS